MRTRGDTLDEPEYRRQEEIEGRLTEMEFAIAQLEPRSRSAVYLRRELAALLEECRGQLARWSQVVSRAEGIDVRVRMIESPPDGGDLPG